MIQEVPLESLLQKNIISPKTYERVKIFKEYIERKYKCKSLKNNEWNNIIKKIDSMDILDINKQQIKNEIYNQEIRNFRKLREKQSIYDYKSLKIIGRGAFGEVHVCKNLKNGEIVAIKKMKKEELLAKNQILHIKHEQLFMSRIKSPYIVDLKASFQDDNFLYLVMEYLPGGDLMNLLIKKDIFTEEESKFYLAELILAIESIHKLDCIHRDIKPDNILIGKDGHIKLTDFGLAKISDKIYTNNFLDQKDVNDLKPEELTHEKNYSCVGTAYYVAPEVLNKKGYGQEIDWWSAGVIFFEMLVGYAPFCSKTTPEVCNKILNWKKYLKIPKKTIISDEARDLIFKMIDDPDKRLGNKGSDEIKKHPFFNGLDWENIREQKAPFIPEIKGDDDTSLFDTYEEKEPFYPPKSKYQKRKDIEFLDYSYIKENQIPEESNLQKELEIAIKTVKPVKKELDNSEANKTSKNSKFIKDKGLNNNSFKAATKSISKDKSIQKLVNLKIINNSYIYKIINTEPSNIINNFVEYKNLGKNIKISEYTCIQRGKLNCLTKNHYKKNLSNNSHKNFLKKSVKINNGKICCIFNYNSKSNNSKSKSRDNNSKKTRVSSHPKKNMLMRNTMSLIKNVCKTQRGTSFNLHKAQNKRENSIINLKKKLINLTKSSNCFNKNSRNKIYSQKSISFGKKRNNLFH